MPNDKKRKNLKLTIIALVLIIATAAVLILISLSMQKKSVKSDLTLSTDQVVTGVIKKMNYTNLSPISTENISRYYEIPLNTVSDSAMYISGKSGTEVELVCFKLLNNEAQKPLARAINEYLEEKVSTSQSTTQPINSKVATHFPYIFVVVAQDSETAVKAFETVLSDSLKTGENSVSTTE